MSFDYSEIAAMASEMLAEFGTSVSVSRVTPGSYDPSTGSNSAGTTETWATNGLRLEYADAEIDGQQVQRGDLRILLAVVTGLDPKSGDSLDIGGDVFRVVKSKPLKPATVAVYLDVQVRK